MLFFASGFGADAERSGDHCVRVLLAFPQMRSIGMSLKSAIEVINPVTV
jgi:hypothetical protein